MVSKGIAIHTGDLVPTRKCQAEILVVIPGLERLDKRLSGALRPASLAELVSYGFSEIQWFKKKLEKD